MGDQFQEYDNVRLLSEIRGLALRVGTEGTVVHVLSRERNVYEVEFFDTHRNTIAVVQVDGSALQLLG